MAVITISRQFGSSGEVVARLVAEKKGYLLVNKAMIVENLQCYGIRDDFDLFDEKNIRNIDQAECQKMETRRHHYLEAMHNFIYDLAIRENLVILGRGGQVLFKDFPPALHVKIIAPLKCRLETVCKSYGLDEAVAARLIEEQDRDRQDYLRQIFDYNWLDLNLYHLVVNTGLFGVDEAVALVINAARLKEDMGDIPVLLPDDILKEQAVSQVQDAKGNAPSFAHPSEEEFAKMLDFYQIKWLYEPKTFPLEWDSEGNITVAFSPDFYLPEHDLYVELTTQKQKLVWKKNKKIRRLKEIYPHVKIRIIYGRDYRGLLRKYGIEEEGEY
jgi:cytidylate kinase